MNPDVNTVLGEKPLLLFRRILRGLGFGTPDRLMAKGVPEEMIKLATEKTQAIRQAYEDICRAKGWK